MVTPQNLKRSKVLLVDDDEALQRLMSEFLGEHGFNCFSLGDGEGIKNFLDKNKVDMVVLDIFLPGQSGLYWMKWLSDNYPDLPVLILSSSQAVADRIVGLESGADDFLIKPFNFQELLLRLRVILRNHGLLTNLEAYSPDAAYLDEEHAVFHRGDVSIRLTTTEARLMQFFVANVGEVVSRDAISEALRGNSHHPLDRSIDVHVNRLRKKIEVKPGVPKFLHTVWGKGYRFILPEKKI